MPIPTFEEAMIPVLKQAAQGGEFRTADFTDAVCIDFDLTEDERNRLLDSGNKRIVVDRTSWAVTYLYRAGLLERKRRGYYGITPEGLRVLAEEPNGITQAYLRRYECFHDWQKQSSGSRTVSGVTDATDSNSSGTAEFAETPNEDLERAERRIHQLLSAEIQDMLHAVSPTKFEQIVLDTVVAMGYGGSQHDAARRVGRSGDEGIDGIINEDRLGLDTIYLQAKKWKSTVGRPEIQKFVGALHGQQATKGVFITTSDFSSEARIYAQGVGTRVVLIDGAALANYMIEYGVGVSTERKVLIRRIDSDYFEDGA